VPKGADRPNEDFVGAVGPVAVVVDGAGIPGAGAICSHGVAWYAQRLGTYVLRLAPASEERSLVDVVGEAIERVTDEHRDTCDTASSISPSAMVAVLRVVGAQVEHLVLGDATVVVGRVGAAPLVVADHRETVVSRAYIPGLEAAATTAERDAVVGELRARRNRPGGFWVAKDDPAVARESVTGSTPLAEVTAAVLLSNGTSRVVDRFGLTDWAGVLAAATAPGGADDLIARVREAEARYGVPPDDASVVVCTDLGVG
jgi:hypothetical protein